LWDADPRRGMNDIVRDISGIERDGNLRKRMLVLKEVVAGVTVFSVVCFHSKYKKKFV
jgi:hypothetical protein